MTTTSVTMSASPANIHTLITKSRLAEREQEETVITTIGHSPDLDVEGAVNSILLGTETLRKVVSHGSTQPLNEKGMTKRIPSRTLQLVSSQSVTNANKMHVGSFNARVYRCWMS